MFFASVCASEKPMPPLLRMILPRLRPLPDVSHRFQPHDRKPLTCLEPPGGMGSARSGSTRPRGRQSIKKQKKGKERARAIQRPERKRARPERGVEGESGFFASPPLSPSRARASELSLSLSFFFQNSLPPLSLTFRKACACCGSENVTKANPLPSITATSERSPNSDAYSRSASTVVPSGMPPMKSLPVCLVCVCVLGFL